MIDLSNWKLTLPVDSKGKFSGLADEISPITKTYMKLPYFYRDVDGNLVFSAPTNGATTSGSNYARSELREMVGTKKAAWKVDKNHKLEADLSILDLPHSTNNKLSKLVIGQIHGPSDELCRLYYEHGGKIYFVDDKAGKSRKETKFYLQNKLGTFTKIPLHSRFKYTIEVKDKKLTVTVVHDGVTYTASEEIGSFWTGKACYFKAGVYLGVGKEGSEAGTQGTGTGTVKFYNLVRS